MNLKSTHRVLCERQSLIWKDWRGIADSFDTSSACYGFFTGSQSGFLKTIYMCGNVTQFSPWSTWSPIGTPNDVEGMHQLPIPSEIWNSGDKIRTLANMGKVEDAHGSQYSPFVAFMCVPLVLLPSHDCIAKLTGQSRMVFHWLFTYNINNFLLLAMVPARR